MKKTNPMTTDLRSQTVSPGGPLYECWLAEMYPTRFRALPAKVVIELSVMDMCKNLLRTLQLSISGFTGHSRQDSFRFCCLVFSGIVKVLRRQVDIIHRDAMIFMNSVIRNEKQSRIK